MNNQRIYNVCLNRKNPFVDHRYSVTPIAPVRIVRDVRDIECVYEFVSKEE
jgi:hypothetical protein